MFVKPRHTVCLFSLLVCLLALSAWPGQARAAGPADNPCLLISQAEVSAALAAQAGKGEFQDSKNPLGQKMCFFPAKGGKPGGLRYASISLVTTGRMSPKMKKSGYSAKRLFEDTKGMLGKVQEVASLGARAYFGTGGLYVLKGDFFLNLKAKAGGGGKDETAALALAQKALARLK